MNLDNSLLDSGSRAKNRFRQGESDIVYKGGFFGKRGVVRDSARLLRAKMEYEKAKSMGIFGRSVQAFTFLRLKKIEKLEKEKQEKKNKK